MAEEKQRLLSGVDHKDDNIYPETRPTRRSPETQSSHRAAYGTWDGRYPEDRGNEETDPSSSGLPDPGAQYPSTQPVPPGPAADSARNQPENLSSLNSSYLASPNTSPVPAIFHGQPPESQQPELFDSTRHLPSDLAQVDKHQPNSSHPASIPYTNRRNETVLNTGHYSQPINFTESADSISNLPSAVTSSRPSINHLAGTQPSLLTDSHQSGLISDSNPGQKPIMEHAVHVRKPKKPVDKDAVKHPTPFFVYYLASFATIGGLLFGYDTGIVSGAMLIIKDYYSLTTIWQELIVSATVGAACLFSLFSGFMCDFFGRKFTIMVASVVFVAGAIVMGAAENKEMLLAGRIIVGIGVGFASMSVPVYIAEAAPPDIRGRLVTLNQLFITIGILISSIVAGGFSYLKDDGWRYMLALAAVPAIVQFVGFIFLPESPRWLVVKGREEQAFRVLVKIRGHTDVQDEIDEMKEIIEEDKMNTGFALGRVFSTPHVRKALFIGCSLQIFQQLVGINTVIYYSATILKMAGFPPADAIWLVLVPNGINFMSTIAGVLLVERLGRKKLLIGSFIGVLISLIVLAVGFQLSANYSPAISNMTSLEPYPGMINDTCFSRTWSNCEQCIEDTDCGFCYLGSGTAGSCLHVADKDSDIYTKFGRCSKENKGNSTAKLSHEYCPTDYTWMAVLGLALFVLSFAPGLGPMPWTINSEIYPMWARSTGNSLSTGCNWICNLLVSLVFLTLTEAITKYGTFWLFAAISVVGLFFTIIFVPETKNKTLEEVEQLFKGNKKGGSENMGYERDVQTPDKYNTRF